MQNKILVTGASGFIGGYLLKAFQKKEIDFLALDAKTISDIPTEKQVSVSLLNADMVDQVMKKYAPNTIIHLAAVASVTHENISEIYNVNVCGTDNLLMAAQKYCPRGTRVILISTAGVYGNQNMDIYNEDTPYNPANHYSYSKMITEYLSKQYKDDLEIIIVRPFNIIGAGQKDNFLIPKLVKHFAYREKSIQVGNIASFRDYINVEYCVNVLTELVIRKEIPFEFLNICSGIPYSGEMVIHLLTEITGYHPQIVVNPKFVRKNEVWKMVGDPELLLSFMHGQKSKPMYNVLSEMLEYYDNQNS